MPDPDPRIARIRERIRRMRRCAIYTRQSPGSQQVLTSCDMQRQVCTDFCEARNWTIRKERYDDVAESSETLVRPALQRLLDDLEEGAIDAVVVYRLDRLTRRLKDFAQLLQQLERNEVELAVVTDPDFTEAGANHSFFTNLAISVAEFEQEMTRERMAEARSALKRHGRRVAGVVPYGYTADPVTKPLVIHRQEADRLAKMFEWAADGRLPREIAEMANQRGWRTKKRTSKQGRVAGGGRWTSRQVLTTLSNPVYAGLIRDGDKLHPGAHDAIVDVQMFDAVRQQIESRRTRKPGWNKRAFNWALKGLLHCGRCGRPMSPNTSKHGNVIY